MQLVINILMLKNELIELNINILHSYTDFISKILEIKVLKLGILM